VTFIEGVRFLYLLSSEGVAMIAICRHCSKSKVNRPRGLCWSCYYTPGVKELYPSTSKYARRGVGNFTGNAPLPPVPTTAVPGSPEKLAVLEQRAKMKLAIFHPADARYEGDPRPIEFLKRQAAEVA
jgi:hypothetical protein